MMPITTATIILTPTGANNQKYMINSIRMCNSSGVQQQVMLYKLKSGESPNAKNLMLQPLLDIGETYSEPDLRFIVENGDQIVGTVNTAGAVSLFLHGLNIQDI